VSDDKDIGKARVQGFNGKGGDYGELKGTTKKLDWYCRIVTKLEKKGET